MDLISPKVLIEDIVEIVILDIPIPDTNERTSSKIEGDKMCLKLSIQRSGHFLNNDISARYTLMGCITIEGSE